MLKDVLIVMGAGLAILGPWSDQPSTPFQDLVQGSGSVVQTGQRVTLHLEVTDSEGREYANTKKRGLPFSFMLDEKSKDPITDWVFGMRVGGQRRLSLDAEASNAFPQIMPANTPLTVVVTLIRASDR